MYIQPLLEYTNIFLYRRLQQTAERVLNSGRNIISESRQQTRSSVSNRFSFHKMEEPDEHVLDSTPTAPFTEHRIKAVDTDKPSMVAPRQMIINVHPKGNQDLDDGLFQYKDDHFEPHDFNVQDSITAEGSPRYSSSSEDEMDNDSMEDSLQNNQDIAIEDVSENLQRSLSLQTQLPLIQNKEQKKVFYSRTQNESEKLPPLHYRSPVQEEDEIISTLSSRSVSKIKAPSQLRLPKIRLTRSAAPPRSKIKKNHELNEWNLPLIKKQGNRKRMELREKRMAYRPYKMPSKLPQPSNASRIKIPSGGKVKSTLKNTIPTPSNFIKPTLIQKVKERTLVKPTLIQNTMIKPTATSFDSIPKQSTNSRSKEQLALSHEESKLLASLARIDQQLLYRPQYGARKEDRYILPDDSSSDDEEDTSKQVEHESHCTCTQASTKLTPKTPEKPRRNTVRHSNTVRKEHDPLPPIIRGRVKHSLPTTRIRTGGITARRAASSKVIVQHGWAHLLCPQ